MFEMLTDVDSRFDRCDANLDGRNRGDRALRDGRWLRLPADRRFTAGGDELRLCFAAMTARRAAVERRRQQRRGRQKSREDQDDRDEGAFHDGCKLSRALFLPDVTNRTTPL